MTDTTQSDLRADQLARIAARLDGLDQLADAVGDGCLAIAKSLDRLAAEVGALAYARSQEARR